jgi:hypothetical protein
MSATRPPSLITALRASAQATLAAFLMMLLASSAQAQYALGGYTLYADFDVYTFAYWPDSKLPANGVFANGFE